MDKSIFYKQADLLISVLPYMVQDTAFALHGGTAINFFIRNMPRISVDIDLTYLPIKSRDETRKAISEQLEGIKEHISSRFSQVKVEEKKDAPDNFITKLFIRKQSVLIKVEPNQVIRRSLFGCEEKDICKKAEEAFEKFVSIKILSFPGLYGSKICAALDRQHPRDIFDIMLLLENEGITDNVRKAFIVYLISHNRPISELLAPRFKDMRPVFEREFAGMASVELDYEKLEHTRETLIKEINRKLTDEEREFLVSFKEVSPKWKLLGVEGAENLPAVKWKLANLMEMDSKKRKKAVDQLKRVIEK